MTCFEPDTAGGRAITAAAEKLVRGCVWGAACGGRVLGAGWVGGWVVGVFPEHSWDRVRGSRDCVLLNMNASGVRWPCCHTPGCTSPTCPAAAAVLLPPCPALLLLPYCCYLTGTRLRRPTRRGSSLTQPTSHCAAACARLGSRCGCGCGAWGDRECSAAAAKPCGFFLCRVLSASKCTAACNELPTRTAVTHFYDCFLRPPLHHAHARTATHRARRRLWSTRKPPATPTSPSINLGELCCTEDSGWHVVLAWLNTAGVPGAALHITHVRVSHCAWQGASYVSRSTRALTSHARNSHIKL